MGNIEEELIEQQEEDEESVKFDIKRIYNKLDTRDILLWLLVVVAWLIYTLMSKEIVSCNNYYQDILSNMTLLK